MAIGASARKDVAQQTSITIRRARPDDAERLAQLSTQLGYPSLHDEVKQRLALIENAHDHAVFVAENSRGKVVGWVHVSISYLVESDPEAEIGGLVVDEAARETGVGRLLMKRAEEWAREKNLHSVYLRSNIIRKEAHEFYKRLGYSIIKTQYAFRKKL